jgi:hypothetical protein
MMKQEELKTILFCRASSIILLPAFKPLCIFCCDAPFIVLFFYHQRPAQYTRLISFPPAANKPGELPWIKRYWELRLVRSLPNTIHEISM